MITVSLQKSFAGTQYKPLPIEKWRVVHEEPKDKYPRLVLRLTHQQCATLNEKQIEALFEAEHERKCEELESSLDFSDENNEDAYATFATKGNHPARRYLLVRD